MAFQENICGHTYREDMNSIRSSHVILFMSSVHCEHGVSQRFPSTWTYLVSCGMRFKKKKRHRITIKYGIKTLIFKSLELKIGWFI